MSYEQTKWGYSKEKFIDFAKRAINKEIDIPEGYEFRIVVDNDNVLASLHPGWDEDGEELGDPIYIGKWWPHDVTIDALILLGLPGEGA